MRSNIQSNSRHCVLFVTRSAKRGGHSIEQVFVEHSKWLESDFDTKFTSIPPGVNGLLKSLKLLFSRADVFHVTGDVHWVVIPLAMRRCVLTVHDIGHLTELKGLRHTIYKLLWFDLPIRLVRRVTVVSEYTKEQLENACPASIGKISVTGNSVPELFKETPPPENPVPRILQVGTAIHKNVENVIRAIAGLECVLVLIGRRRSELESLLQDCEVNYEWKTDVPYQDVADEYRKADLVTFVSFHEGFGVPILEAQATGRPIIVSKRCSLPEVAGPEAIYADADSYKDIRRAIDWALQSSENRAQVVQAGFENIERFSAENVTSRLKRVYEELVPSS